VHRGGHARERAVTARLAICIDDFGAAPGIAAAVQRLASIGRVQAVSCLVQSEGWRRDAPVLATLGPQVDRGLHFCLTEGRPLSAELADVWPTLPALSRLLAASHLRALPRDALKAELLAQLAAFTHATGEPPRFVDGHQHVHHLPGVREMVLDVLDGLRPRPAVRNTGRIRGPGFAFKRAVIERSGGRALATLLARRGYEANDALTGVYDFERRDYGALFRAWVQGLPTARGALLFCHPSASHEPAPADPIAAAREREFRYLASARCGDDLAASGVALGSVWRALSETTRRD